jgi:glycosyltransferase involved in cell wall biosynthesis
MESRALSGQPAGIADEKRPLVSIVVPSYNHDRYLGAAIDSILAQDYAPIELIVIDDGSTDGSRDVLARYGNRFHWEAQDNKGQVATLNRGWTMSRGEIISYLSADDLLYPAAVSAAVRHLGTNPDAVLSYSDFDLIDPESAVVRRVRTPEFDYARMVTEFMCPPGPGAFWRRTAFHKAGLWNPAFHQMLDYEYWLRLGVHGRFVRIPEALAAYRVHPGSQSFASGSNIRPEEPIRIIDHYFSLDGVPGDIRALKDRSLSNAHIQAARLHIRMGNIRRGVSSVRQAFSLNPATLFSRRTLHMLFNAAFNRLGHRILWTARGAARAALGGTKRRESVDRAGGQGHD